MQNSKLSPGQVAPDFFLPATDGNQYRLADHLPRSKATVVMFICNHCPYVRAYIPRLVALASQYAGKVGFVAISSNDVSTYPQDSFDHMRMMVGQWGLNFPYLYDENQDVARAYGAERTPEIFLLDPQGVCRYEGGVDDSYQSEEKVKDRPLRDAIEQVIAGQEVTRPRTWAIGCTIKWKK
jgi:thiol-disulfide isomerase/thioredoxin